MREKIPSNFHTHSEYCDGKGRPSDYIRSALDIGFERLGFSSHAPLPFETSWAMNPGRLPGYLGEISSLAEEYEDRIEILKGLKIDYMPDIGFPGEDWVESLGLDYFIGSVHFMGFLGNDTRFTADGDLEYQEGGEKYVEHIDKYRHGAYYSNIKGNIWCVGEIERVFVANKERDRPPEIQLKFKPNFKLFEGR